MSVALAVTITTPEETLLQAEGVQKVRVRLADGGWLSIYPRHAPLIAEIAPGAVQITTAEGETSVLVDSGLVRVSPDRVLVLVGRSDVPFDAGDAEVDTGEVLRYERLVRELLSALRSAEDDQAPSGKAHTESRGMP